MNKLEKFLSKIPVWLSSTTSILIYIFLFIYLVVFALIALSLPALREYAPSADAQLILGNYTNVLSALGASIAAGSGISMHRKIKNLHKNHQQLQETMDELDKKLDKLNAKKK